MRELQGTWKDEKETVSFIIKDNMIKIDRDKEIPIVVTETNSGYKKRFTIRPADAGESNFISLTYLYYNGEVITGSYMIMDANSPELIFRKAD